MSAADQEIYDPVITFGKYKSEGLKLSEIPDDYLTWLQKPTDDGSDFVHKGVNWCQLARAEVTRRATGGPLMTRRGAQLPIADDQVPFKAKNDKQRLKSETIEPTTQAMDMAANLLLREFITREDKDATLSHWLALYTKEAAQYGEPNGRDVVNPDVTVYMFTYRGHKFYVRVAKTRMTLVDLEAAGGTDNSE